MFVIWRTDRLRRIGAPELSSLMVTLGGVLALYAALTAWLGSDIADHPVREEAAVVTSVANATHDITVFRLRLPGAPWAF